MLNPRAQEHEHLLAAMRDLHTRLYRHYSDRLRVQGASLARLKLLGFIQRSGFVRSTDIAEAFGFAPRTVTEALDSLERDRLVQRDPDPTDRRAKRITLTPMGLRVLEEAAPHQLAITTQIFEVMTPGDEAELLRLIELLNARVVDLDLQKAEEMRDTVPAGASGK